MKMYEDDVEFTIKCRMRKRWVNTFCSFLKHMELCGNLGHSASIAFYSDGDGDFHPKFEINTQFERKEGLETDSTPEVIYDAG